MREIAVDFPEAEARHAVMSSLWARMRIDDLMSQDYAGMQQGAMKPELKETITNLGLEYRLMTQFTSFVAVEEMIVTDGGQPRRIDVPVEVPEGVNGHNAEPQGSPGGPTGLFTAYKVNNTGSFALARTISGGVVTTSGTNAGKPKSRRAGGGGGRSAGMGSGSAAGGSGGRVYPSAPNSPPAAPVIVAEVDGAAYFKDDDRSPAEKQRAELASKLHPSILAVVDRLKDNKLIGSADEVRFIRNGKAEIQIWLTDKSEETLAKLKELGFEVVLDPKSAKLVIGRLPIEKLATLPELKFVRYVAPQAANN